MTGKHRFIAGSDASDGELDGKPPAVLAHGENLDALADNRVAAGRAGPPQTEPVALAQLRRDDQIGHLASDGRIAAVAKHPFRRRIKIEDPAFVVDGDDPIERSFENG